MNNYSLLKIKIKIKNKLHESRIRKFDQMLNEDFNDLIKKIKDGKEDVFVSQLTEHLKISTEKLVQFRPGGYLCSWKRREDGGIESAENDLWVKKWKIVKINERRNNRGQNKGFRGNQNRKFPY